PDRIIPLNPAGKADGTEYGWSDWYRPALHTVEWKDGVRDGYEKVYVLGGKGEAVLKAEIPWVNGELSGEKKTFFGDGAVQSITTFANGEAEGESRTFAPDGSVIRISNFKKGQRDGLMKDFWPGTEQVKREIP